MFDYRREIIKLTTCSQYIIDNKGIIWNNTNSQIGPAVLGLEDLGKTIPSSTCWWFSGSIFPNILRGNAETDGFLKPFPERNGNPQRCCENGSTWLKDFQIFSVCGRHQFLKPMDITNDQRLDCTNWNHHGSVDPPWDYLPPGNHAKMMLFMHW